MELDCQNLTKLITDIKEIFLPDFLAIRDVKGCISKQAEIEKIMENCPLSIFHRRTLARKYDFKFVGILPDKKSYFGRSKKGQSDAEKMVIYLIDEEKQKTIPLIGADYCHHAQNGAFWTARKAESGFRVDWRFYPTGSDHSTRTYKGVCIGFGSGRVLWYVNRDIGKNVFFYHDENDAERIIGLDSDYAQATVFDNNRAIVQTTDGDVKLIDENGNLVKLLGNDTQAILKPFSEGRAWLELYHKIILIDEAGIEIRRLHSEIFKLPVHKFSDGICPVQGLGDNCLYIDRDGWPAFEKTFSAPEPYFGGSMLQWENRMRYFVGLDGEELFPGRRYTDARHFSEGLAAVKEEVDFPYYFIGQDGKQAFDKYFKEIVSDFHDGLACVRNIDGKYCYIDKHGNENFYGNWEFDQELVSRFK